MASYLQIENISIRKRVILAGRYFRPYTAVALAFQVLQKLFLFQFQNRDLIHSGDLADIVEILRLLFFTDIDLGYFPFLAVDGRLDRNRAFNRHFF